MSVTNIFTIFIYLLKSVHSIIKTKNSDLDKIIHTTSWFLNLISVRKKSATIVLTSNYPDMIKVTIYPCIETSLFTT